MRPIDYEKVEQLRQLADIPFVPGQSIQFIHPELNLVFGDAGIIRFGQTNRISELKFYSLDEAIVLVKRLRRANHEE